MRSTTSWSPASSIVVAAVVPGANAPVATVAVARCSVDGIEFDLPTDDPVAAAISGGSSVCLIAEQAPSYYEIKAVVVRGRPTSLDPTAADDSDVPRACRVTDEFDFGKLRSDLTAVDATE